MEFEMYDLIIIGSGAAGTWAAFGAARKQVKTLVVDVGIRPDNEQPLADNIYHLRRQDKKQRQYLLGKEFESLHNIHQPYLSPKLKAPRFQYVLKKATGNTDIQMDNFDILQSFSFGGLANAWGAGVYRYNDRDLEHFLINQADLDPYYDIITDEIGISGTKDDLFPVFGSTHGLQPPLKMDRLSKGLLAAYHRKKRQYNSQGLYFGRSRVAILNQEKNGRSACQYDNLSFWQPMLSSIYSPAMTLDKLIQNGSIDYIDQHLALKYSENKNEVVLQMTNLRNDRKDEIKARRLILAAGAVNSAKIVLNSHNDTQTQLPLLENPTSLIPFVHPFQIGKPVEKDSHGLCSLILTYKGPLWGTRVQGSFYHYSSPLCSDVFMDFPLSVKGNISCCKYMIPAMSIIQLFYADQPHPENYLKLKPDGKLFAHCGYRQPMGTLEKSIIKLMAGNLMFSHPKLVRFPAAGNGIHYAGTLPMQKNQLPYTTQMDGRITAAKHIYAADASVFPFLPEKNHTLTVMANAFRIAEGVADTLSK